MKICFVSSESDPFIKTGGLADVSGSLPVELEKLGCDVDLFIPLYNSIDIVKFGIKPVNGIQGIEVNLGNKNVKFDLFICKINNTNINAYFIDCPVYFHRDRIYTNDPDEDERFILFQIGVLKSLQLLDIKPDIIHCNDWQTGLIPAYIKRDNEFKKFFEKSSAVFSIHNIAYQGLFDKTSFSKTNLPESDFRPMGPYELYDKFCFIKAGISFAEVVTTVSPSYSKEIQTPEFGCGLEGVLVNRKNDLYGIINGINNKIWNPGNDKLIPANYTFKTFQDKIKNKTAFLKKTNLQFNENTPLLGIVSRFAWQKGFELFEPIMDNLLASNIQIAVLGEGEEKYEKYFKGLAGKYPGKIAAFVEYNNELAHLITAASDIFLMPSKYEPCGLNQMYSLQYGTIPVVRKTGGLADTVKDADENPAEGNGFTFSGFDSNQFYNAIERALLSFNNKSRWMKIVEQGMKEDFSWNSSALKYLEIYQKAISKSEV